MAFTSLQEILDTCEKEKIPFWEAVLADDLNERVVTREDSRKQMAGLWKACGRRLKVMKKTKDHGAGL